MSQVLTQSLTQTTYRLANQCGTDLLVLLASAPAQDNLTVQLYGQSLSLPDTGRQDAVFQHGDEIAVSIQDKQDGLLYTLIFAQANNLFPVQVTPVVFGSGNTADITLQLTAQHRADMQLAEKFVQAITALPSSGLADGYVKALAGADPKTVNSFFQGTTDYKSLTAEKVVAVQTYYNTYPYIWNNYAASKTYQLCSSDGATTKVAGTLTITAPTSAVASINKNNDAFQLVYKAPDDGSQPAPLQYAQGWFRSRPGSGNTLALQGLFALKSQLSGKEADKEIISLVKGTVNGKEVLGYGEAQDSEPWISLDGLLHPGSVKDWLQLSGLVGGMAALLLAMGAAVAGVTFAVIRRWRKTGGTDSNPADAAPRNEHSSDASSLTQSAGEDYAKERTLYDRTNKDMEASYMRTMLEKQERGLQWIISNTDDPGLQDVGDNLYEIGNGLDAWEQGSQDINFERFRSLFKYNAPLLASKTLEVLQKISTGRSEDTATEELASDLIREIEDAKTRWEEESSRSEGYSEEELATISESD